MSSGARTDYCILSLPSRLIGFTIAKSGFWPLTLVAVPDRSIPREGRPFMVERLRYLATETQTRFWRGPGSSVVKWVNFRVRRLRVVSLLYTVVSCLHESVEHRLFNPRRTP